MGHENEFLENFLSNNQKVYRQSMACTQGIDCCFDVSLIKALCARFVVPYDDDLCHALWCFFE